MGAKAKARGGGFYWFFAGVFFSPLLAMIGLVAVMQGQILERLDALATRPEPDASSGRSSSRFATLAGE